MKRIEFCVQVPARPSDAKVSDDGITFAAPMIYGPFETVVQAQIWLEEHVKIKGAGISFFVNLKEETG